MSLIIVLIIRVVLLGISISMLLNTTFFTAYIGASIFLSTIHFVIFILSIDLLSFSLKYGYSKSKGRSYFLSDNFHFGINNIAKLLYATGLIFYIFNLFGIHPLNLITSLSIVAAAIAVITKDFINDFLMGIYFSFSENFEIDDYVKIGDHQGKIVAIHMMKVKLLNDDDLIVYLSNASIYSKDIINFTKRDIRRMSIDFQLDINAVKNIEALETQLKESLETFAEYIEPTSYRIKIVSIQRDALDLKFQYSLKKMDRKLQLKLRRLTVRNVFNFVSEQKSVKAPHS